MPMENITTIDLSLLTITADGTIQGDVTTKKHLLNPYPKTWKALCAISKLLKNKHHCFVSYKDVYFELLDHTPSYYHFYPESHIYPDWTKDEWRFLKAISRLDKKHLDHLTNRQLTNTDDFFTWRPTLFIDPNWFKDYRGHFGMNRYKNKKETFLEKDLFALRLTETNGIVIPSNDYHKNPLRPQIIPDKVTYQLKAKMNNHTTIKHDSYFDKKKRVYTFLKNGEPSRLQIIDKTTLEDKDGQFTITDNLVQQLKNRGYQLPPTINHLTIDIKGKYTYLKPGNLSPEKIEATLVPIQETPNKRLARVIIVEGALKGVIVSDILKTKKPALTKQLYADSLYVMQLNGIHCPYNKVLQQLKEAYDQLIIYIALDMDLFTNKRVATQMHTIANDLTARQIGPLTDPGTSGIHCLMLWDKSYKGLDDYLLAVNDPQIDLKTVDQMFDLDTMPNYRNINVNGSVVVTNYSEQQKQDDHLTAIEEQYKDKQTTYHKRLENALGTFFNS